MFQCRRLLGKPPSSLSGKTLIFPEHALPDAYENILSHTPSGPTQAFQTTKARDKYKKHTEKARQKRIRATYKGEGGEPWYQ